MIDQKIKNYKTLLALIYFAIAVLMAITPFVTLFKVEFLGFVDSEKGIDYFNLLIDYKSEILGDIENSKFWSEVILAFQILTFAISFACIPSAIRILTIPLNRNNFDENCQVDKNSGFITFGVSFLLYYGIILFLLKQLNDYGAGIVKYTSFIHATMIAAIGLCIVGVIFIEVTKKEVKTLLSSETKGQEKAIDLIIRYKELLDNGIITEEEYNEKKDKLLNEGEKE